MNGYISKAVYQLGRHMELLLEADPDEAVVGGYIQDCELYEYVEEGELLGVAALIKLGEGEWELKNIAVRPSSARRGIGSALLGRIIGDTRPDRLIVGTADASPDAIAFYRRNGFEEFGSIEGFFTRGYAEPVYDNGRLCVDMVLLEWKGGQGGE